MSRQFVDAFASNHPRLRQIECAQEHGLLLLNVIFAEMFLQARSRITSERVPLPIPSS